MSFPSPTGDPDCDRKLWWRCVFIAAAVQPVLLLLSLIFQSTFFLKILMIPYLLFTGLFVNGLWHSVEHGDTQSVFMGAGALLALLPFYFVLTSFFFGTAFYLLYWLSEKDY